MISDWNELKLVLAIARHGSLVKAASTMRVDHSTVYRRLRSLEDRLGAKLFDRRPDGAYSTTAEGDQVAAVAERIEGEMQTLDRTVTGGDHRLTGRVRVTSSETLAYQLLTKQIALFREAHPGILVELAVDNRVLSLARREADVALRPLRPREADLWGRKLADVAWALYAAPADGDARFETDDLFAGMPVICWGEDVNNVRAASWLADRVAVDRIAYRTSSLVNQFVAARAGIGAALLPCYLGDAEPGLRRLSNPIADVQGELWIVTHADLRHTARIRTFLEVVGNGLALQRDRIEGIRER